MKTFRRFSLGGSRYFFDNHLCPKQFAQIDTEQDAPYFGTWANPHRLLIVSYCEGDIVIKKADSTEEFVKNILDIKKFNDELGYKFIGIDPGFNKTLYQKFVEIGLGEFLPKTKGDYNE